MTLTILENPLLQPLNLIVQSTSYAYNPNVNTGLSLQGSFIVNINVKTFQDTNTTSGELVNTQINVGALNLMSITILILPFVIYLYSEIGITKQTVKRKMK